MNLKRQVYFVCANNRESELIAELEKSGLSWREVKGQYNGVPERSFIIVDNVPNVELEVNRLAHKYSQESYLKVNELGVASLVYLYNAHIQVIGDFKEVNREQAISNEGYTQIDDKYFIAIK